VSIPETTALILAGGLGRRIGGLDKGLIEWQGQPLVAHIIERIAPQTDQLIISANRNLDHYLSFGYPVVQDELSGYQGPLAGIHAAMQAVTTQLVLTLPCDSPSPPRDLLARLWRLRRDSSVEIAVAHDGQRAQILHALIPTALKEDLREFLDSGRRKTREWYARHSMAYGDFSTDADAFANFNTLAELRTRAC
jgi:molybdenum cofactor guanylyltransferase